MKNSVLNNSLVAAGIALVIFIVISLMDGRGLNLGGALVTALISFVIAYAVTWAFTAYYQNRKG